MNNEKFCEYMQILKNEKKSRFEFSSGYEKILFDNFLKNNKIYHITKTEKCKPVCIARFTMIEY